MADVEQMMAFARRRYLPNLAAAKHYRVGKYSAIGPGGKERGVLLDLRGSGVLKRIWTTHSSDASVELRVSVDGSPTPVLCGEDYFHMAYMRVWNLTPYSGCPTHAERYRHHLEMPIPFQDSLVFNWGTFAGQPAKAVAFWYQESPDMAQVQPEPTWRLSGPFPLAMIDKLGPGYARPALARAWQHGPTDVPSVTWRKAAHQGFVDLCHIHRRYIWPVPPSTGYILAGICTCAELDVWAARASDTLFRIGCDDPIRVFLNGSALLRDDGRSGPDPFRGMQARATLQPGLNRVQVVVGNTVNTNWLWNGFSFTMQSDLGEGELRWVC